MVKAMDKMRYPRKKGYAGRYVRHELGKNKLNLLLGCVFLLGALVGCQLAGQDPETILSQLGSLFSTTGQSAGFLDTVVASFAANAVLLLILCLCGLGAVFQPLALGVLFWRGLGLGVLGVYSYSTGERAAVLYYLLVLLPQALLEVLLLVSAAGEPALFGSLFHPIVAGKGDRNAACPAWKFGRIPGKVFDFLSAQRNRCSADRGVAPCLLFSRRLSVCRMV